jgi:purine-nucleoside phosphorylase
MLKVHNLKTTKANFETVSFFYIREKSGKTGISRFRVFIIDVETSAVYETIFQCYEFQIAQRVTDHIENQIGVTIPF